MSEYNVAHCSNIFLTIVYSKKYITTMCITSYVMMQNIYITEKIRSL